jgi:solute carrier family 25 protein 39/40
MPGAPNSSATTNFDINTSKTGLPSSPHQQQPTMSRDSRRSASTLELEDLRGARARPAPEATISPAQRMLAACSGSLLTSLLGKPVSSTSILPPPQPLTSSVTPLDVVRVRLQSQVPTGSSPALSYDHLGRTRFLNPPPTLGVTACCREIFFPPAGASGAWASSASSEASACLAAPNLIESCLIDQSSRRSFSGTWEGLTKIARYEGVTSLWRGLSPTLLMAVPSNVIYFTGYDWLRFSEASPFAGLGDTWAPLIAGSSARALAASVISPVEMFKTRLQATSTTGKGSFRATWAGVKTMVQTEGATSLWRGLGLTLWRDVPFSGIYWFGYETIKESLQTQREAQWSLLHDHPSGIRLPSAVHRNREELHAEHTFSDSFLAGAISGAAAAFVTTPFDVGKTRQQVVASRGTISGTMAGALKDIWKEEGVRGLWRGCSPRMLKVAPACAIMISSYEVCKSWAARTGRQDERD